ncbi:MAG: ParB/RepB/Spo0J family partition protein [Elusimicrobia bacterium]|nr:ParB/RepB/Spo0J family partition protein [Elusimicrobiota bacterium]
MRQALGKGIDALISKVQNNNISQEAVHKIPVDSIRPNRRQPRRDFDETSLAELVQSIKEHGLLQPITVWPDDDGSSFELIAGERRWRACKAAGLKEVDSIVKKGLSEQQKFGLSLIENIQRKDLNAIEAALAYRHLMDEFSVSQTDIARKLGKSKSAVSNTLRLLELDDEIQKGIQGGAIHEGHARALLSIPDRDKRKEAYEKILTEKSSVREIEDYARGFHARRPRAKPAGDRRHKSPEVLDIEARLEKHLGAKVEITPGAAPENGKITIHYYSLDDFDRITRILKK